MTFDFDLRLVLPYLLVLGRVSGFMAAGPLFSWSGIPAVVRAGLMMVMTLFLSVVAPPPAMANIHWLAGVLLLAQEILCGAVLGLAANLVFLAVQQGGWIIATQIGFTDAEIVDPSTQEDVTAIGLFFEFIFMLLFLTAGGHLVLLTILSRSYQAFPIGQAPDFAQMARLIVEAGSAMLVMGMKFAGPMFAAFLVLSVVLAVVARVLPDLNILFEAYPVRVGMGFALSAAMMPTMNGVVDEVTGWMNRNLTG